MQVYKDAAGNLSISRDDHRAFCEGLTKLAEACGGKAVRLMRHALTTGAPADRDGMEAVKYFGKELPIIVKTLEPLIEAIEGMLPDFKAWMPLTLFGNDKDFILALLAMHRVMSEGPRLTGKERRQRLAPALPRLPESHACTSGGTR